MTIFEHEIKRNFTSLLIWSAAVGTLIFACMLLYPEMGNEMDNLDDMFSNMGEFSIMFGLDKLNFSTAMGFYGIEIGNILPIGGSLFAALLGISALAKEESDHTVEFLLTHPVSRSSVVSQKLIAMLSNIVFFNMICVALALWSFSIIGEDIDIEAFSLYHLAQLIMQIEVGCICFGISAFLKRNTIGIGLGIAAILFFLNIFINISSSMEFLKYITPFRYADSTEIISSTSIDVPLMMLGVGITVVSIGVAFIRYHKKDIAA